jgi:hypothetical protein
MKISINNALRRCYNVGVINAPIIRSIFMKRSICLVYSIGLALFGIAQAAGPVFNSTDLAPVGTRCQKHQVTIPSNVDTASVGANQTWDFSNLQSTLSDTVERIDGSTVPQDIAAALPNANLWSKVYNGTSVSYNAERESSTSIAVIATGAHDSSSGIVYTQLLTVPEISWHIPFSYGDAFADSFQASGYAFMIPYTVEYDAYGTLITPFGTYTNVIRTRWNGPNGDVSYQWDATNPSWNIMNITRIATGGSAAAGYSYSITININNLISSASVRQRTLNPGSSRHSITSVTGVFDILGRLQGTVSSTNPQLPLSVRRYGGIFVGVTKSGQVELINTFAGVR